MSSTTREREISGAFTSKYGFSVVAPMRTTSRSSTACSRASCCDLLNRWISSMNRMVRRPSKESRSRASSIARRMSATPEVTADTSQNAALVVFAMTRARLVFPEPAGPYRMSELSSSRSIADRSAVPGPTARSCPTNSSSVRGRMRAAKGAPRESASSAASENRSAIFMPPSGAGRLLRRAKSLALQE